MKKLTLLLSLLVASLLIAGCANMPVRPLPDYAEWKTDRETYQNQTYIINDMFPKGTSVSTVLSKMRDVTHRTYRLDEQNYALIYNGIFFHAVERGTYFRENKGDFAPGTYRLVLFFNQGYLTHFEFKQ